MDYGCTDKLTKYLKKVLNERRYEHSLGVADAARALAEVYGEDPDKAYFAGLAHDIAKCFDEDTMNEYVLKYDLPSKYLNNTPLAHSKVGAEILRDKFGVKDEDLLNAVAYHTTGRYGMSLLEEILYVADLIDRTRAYDRVDELRHLAPVDLDEAALIIAEFNIEQLENREKALDPDTLGVVQFIKDKKSGKET